MPRPVDHHRVVQETAGVLVAWAIEMLKLAISSLREQIFTSVVYACGIASVAYVETHFEKLERNHISYEDNVHEGIAIVLIAWLTDIAARRVARPLAAEPAIEGFV